MLPEARRGFNEPDPNSDLVPKRAQFQGRSSSGRTNQALAIGRVLQISAPDRDSVFQSKRGD
jgi:hypothetical protein